MGRIDCKIFLAVLSTQRIREQEIRDFPMNAELLITYDNIDNRVLTSGT